MSDRRVARGSSSYPSYTVERTSVYKHGAGAVRLVHAYVSRDASASHSDPDDAEVTSGSDTSIDTVNDRARVVSYASSPVVGRRFGTGPRFRRVVNVALVTVPSHDVTSAANAYVWSTTVRDGGIESLVAPSAFAAATVALRGPRSDGSTRGTPGHRDGSTETRRHAISPSHAPSARDASSSKR